MVEVSYYKDFSINKELFKKWGEFWYNEKEDILYFEIKWFLPVKLLIKNLAKEDTYICATHWFKRLPTCFRGGINLEYLKREIEQIKLIKEGKIMLHAGCYKNTLVTGFTNMGKTWEILKNREKRVVSDEYVIISPDLTCTGSYRKMAITPIHIKQYSLKVPFMGKISLFIKGILNKIAPMLFEAIIWLDIDLKRQESTKVSNIQFLPDLDSQRTYQRLVLTTENEFPFFSNYVLQVYSYITGFPLEKLQIEGRKLIWEIVKQF